MKHRLLLKIICLSSLLILTSCAIDSYEVEPYSEERSWNLLSEEPSFKKDQALGIRAVYFFYKPEQNTAFPVVANYRDSDPSLLVRDRLSINEIIDHLKKSDVKGEPFGSGTLHMVVEFSDDIERSAYYIFYMEGTSFAPIFLDDSAGYACYNFLTWLMGRYPELEEAVAQRH